MSFTATESGIVLRIADWMQSVNEMRQVRQTWIIYTEKISIK